MTELGYLWMSVTAQCERCGRDFRTDYDNALSLRNLCESCIDHAVLCGCSDEFCEVQ